MKDTLEADAYIDRTAPKRRGTQIHFWLDDKRLAKLDAMAEITGKTRTATLKALIDGVDFSKIPDRSCKEAAAMLGRIGGLMKLNRIGSKEDVQKIFQAVKEMRKAIYGNDNS